MFHDIQFDADHHRFTLHGENLIAVTSYLKKFQKPFDRDGIADRVAARDGRPVEDILAEWDAKGQAAMELGHRVHEYIADVLMGVPTPQDDKFLSLNQPDVEIAAFDVFWEKMREDVSVKQVEWVIGDRVLGVAGIVDSLLYSPETKQYHVWDWKTGKFDVDNPYDNLYPPFALYSASKLNIYSLQVSLYRLILERNTSLDVGDSYIVHLSNSGRVQVYKAKDLRPELALHFGVELEREVAQ